jgi:hypothetical protein
MRKKPNGIKFDGIKKINLQLTHGDLPENLNSLKIISEESAQNEGSSESDSVH